jgi:hypothetical protein
MAFACLLVLLGAAGLQAQDVALNGDFETNAISPAWELSGGNTYTTLVKFQTVLGQDSLCLKRRPGLPSSNGGIYQYVHLIEGVTYTFHADIASQESG